MGMPAPTGPKKTDSNRNTVPEGINMRKEAQKLDTTQFNSNDVNHVEPIISVLRPGVPKNTKKIKTAQNESHQPHTAGAAVENGDLEEPAKKMTDDQKKQEAYWKNKETRAWKRLRPDHLKSEPGSGAEDNDYDTRQDSNVLPSVQR